ncbi:MAG: glycosyltransferase [Verrucomicrobiota bacterium]
MTLAFDGTAFQLETSRGGVSLYMQEILAGLARKGFSLPVGIDRRLDPEVRAHCSAMGVQWETTDLRGVLWRDKVGRRLAASGYTALWYPTQFTAWLPPLPTVSTLHDFAGLRSPPRAGWRARAYMNLSLRTMIRQSDRLIAVSESTAEDLRRYFPAAAHKMVVARHGMPSDVRQAAPGLLESKPDRGGMPFRYLFLDGANDRKRLDLSIGALTRLGWGGRELRITGNPELVGLRIGSTPPAGITLLGRLSRSDLLKEIRDVDIVLYVSDFEGFGFPILESLPLETTVVIFPGDAELEVGGEHVVVARRRSADSLAAAMLQAEERCRDRSWREAIHAHSLQFDWEESIAVHQRIFLELTDGMKGIKQ